MTGHKQIQHCAARGLVLATYNMNSPPASFVFTGPHVKAPTLATIFFLLAFVSWEANAATATEQSFGDIDGRPVRAVMLANNTGINIRIISYGAAIQELDLPDRNGRSADVVLSYPDIQGFLSRPQYFGATVGRFANRINKGSFYLAGNTYQVTVNDGQNSLHGGTRGFDKVLWSVADVKSGLTASAKFSYTSPDGDQGYPGELHVSVTYGLVNDELTITYHATTTKSTIVNLTNHSYFNLGGASSGRDILDQRLTILADQYTPIDSNLIPTGERKAVVGTAFDFRTPRRIGERLFDGSENQLVIAHGYDHNFVLNGGTKKTPRLVARLVDPVSGRTMEIRTTEPGLQLYSGNFLDGTVLGKGAHIYRQSAALCLEPQRFPDAPNQPSFPSARLDPGQTYIQVTQYRFSRH